MYLLSILEGADGLDLAEFAWFDPEQEDGCYRAWDFQWCLTGDTVLYTDAGRRRLDQVVGPVRLLAGDTGDRGRWVDAEVRYFGQAEVLDVLLERRGVQRTLRATERHRWFAGSGRADRRLYHEKTTAELQPGDHLQPTTSPRVDFGMDRTWIQRGVVTGDGTVVRGKESLVRLYGAKRALSAYFDTEPRPYTGNAALTDVPAVEHRGLPGRFKTELPDVSGKPEELWGWLAGYFATDGSVLPDGTCVISTTSVRLAQAVRDVATAVGVVCSAIGHRDRVVTAPDGATRPVTEMRVVLRVTDMPAAFFLHPLHRLRVELLGRAAGRAIDAWRVVEVRRTGAVEDVYCAEVPGAHSFVLDGDILTGNSWYLCEDAYQIDQGARATGKTVSMKMRAFAFPFNKPGQKMLVTAPELNHLRPITDAIETQLLSCRLGKEMLPATKGNGMNRQPHWQVRFKNGSQIISRLPNKDGKGVKSMHVIQIELDEAQDYPLAGWIEIVETLNRGLPGAMWRCHGVSKGVRDRFFEYTEEGSGWCLPAGTLVYGVDGPFPVQDAVVGTAVWAVDPDGSLQHDEITGVLDNGTKATWKISAKGGLALETTLNHPYLLLSRAGTRRTRRDLALEWVDAQDVQVGDFIVGVQELDSTGVEQPAAEAILQMLADHSPVREVPSWVWRSPRPTQMAFLAGYAMGDGSRSRQVSGQDAMAFGTASEHMARQLRALCHYLGLRPTALEYQDRSGAPISGTGHYWRFHAYVDAAWFWQIPRSYSSVRDGQMLEGLDKRLVARRVSVSVPSGRVVPTYDITVGKRHNYIAEGVVVHNTVHRPKAMNRPTWSKEEREEKILVYGGSRQNIDYKRNIYGEHGDASNSVFVLSRLMAAVDTDSGSEYNQDVYTNIRVEFERLQGGSVIQFLDIPGSHITGYSQQVDRKEVGSPRGYSAYWGGADIGVTNHPSEFLVCGQRQGTDFLELLLRIQLSRINTDDQKLVVEWLFDRYGDKLKAFALDKMQPVSEPVLTPSGWRPIGELAVGDQVIGSDGAPTEVTGVYPQTDRRVMKVTCTDGSWTRCGPEHLWTVKHTQQQGSKVLTTEQLAEKVNRPGARQWTLPMLSGPAQTQTAALPIDPYVLGALLGDGNLRTNSIRMSNPDAEVIAELADRLPAGYLLKASTGCDFDLVAAANLRGQRQRDAKGHFLANNEVLNHLRGLGLSGKLAHQKFIPAAYLQAAPQDRLLVLQGLMDTDGWVAVTGKSSHIGIRLSSEQMIRDIVSLVESLGGSAHYRSHATSCNGKPGRTAYRATLMLPERVVPFRLSRKVDAMILRTQKPCRRYIASIEPDGEESSVCIRVAAEDELYVTRHHLLTHNTGVGFPIWDQLSRHPRFAKRIYGYNFSEKVVVGFEDRPLEKGETQEDLAIWRNVVEATTDLLRNDYVDAKKMRLPYDREVLLEFQGQTYTVIKDSGNPYGQRRLFAGGSFHTLDAMKMLMAGRHLPPLDDQLHLTQAQVPVLDVFIGM